MSIEIEGRIVFNNVVCEKCGERISSPEEQHDSLRCKSCGAFYRLADNKVEENNVVRTYDFSEFRCLYTFGLQRCDNSCVASEMYCEEHTSDDCFKSVKDNIEYLMKRLELAERVLERMEESKKLILIRKVSGIDEEDYSLWEDED